MKKHLKKTVSLLVVMVMLISSMSVSVFAAEPNVKDDGLYFVSDQEEYAEPNRGNKSIYADVFTLVYTGIGYDQWLHITPQMTPNYLTIRMVDYDGTQVWYEQFWTSGTTHWFVGSNVKYVYLKGTPGGVVSVTNTDH